LFKFYIFRFYVLILFFIFTNTFIIKFLGWERIRFISFLLISWWGSRWDANSSSICAVFYNRLRDLFILILILNFNFKILSFSIILLICFSVFGKSSLLIFNWWLPIAIERPTPVSSLLHSSTIVVARVTLAMILSYI